MFGGALEIADLSEEDQQHLVFCYFEMLPAVTRHILSCLDTKTMKQFLLLNKFFYNLVCNNSFHMQKLPLSIKPESTLTDIAQFKRQYYEVNLMRYAEYSWSDFMETELRRLGGSVKKVFIGGVFIPFDMFLAMVSCFPLLSRLEVDFTIPGTPGDRLDSSKLSCLVHLKVRRAVLTPFMNVKNLKSFVYIPPIMDRTIYQEAEKFVRALGAMDSLALLCFGTFCLLWKQLPEKLQVKRLFLSSKNDPIIDFVLLFANHVTEVLSFNEERSFLPIIQNFNRLTSLRVVFEAMSEEHKEVYSQSVNYNLKNLFLEHYNAKYPLTGLITIPKLFPNVENLWLCIRSEKIDNAEFDALLNNLSHLKTLSLWVEHSSLLKEYRFKNIVKLRTYFDQQNNIDWVQIAADSPNLSDVYLNHRTDLEQLTKSVKNLETLALDFRVFQSDLEILREHAKKLKTLKFFYFESPLEKEEVRKILGYRVNVIRSCHVPFYEGTVFDYGVNTASHFFKNQPLFNVND